jgi:CelD/BcsL family acetyltransferase involved in cellulose biosynthesis
MLGRPVAISAPCPTDPATLEHASLVAEPVAFDGIDRATWDGLLARTAAATPFSRWSFHRAWWDAYGATAHEQYLLLRPAGDQRSQGQPPATRAIVPLMHRHMVEPEDAATATVLRRARALDTAVEPSAKAVFFGASYHADYATVLAEPADLPAASHALACALATAPDRAHGATEWDVVDLRRLRRDDPALPALAQAFGAAEEREGWQLTREQEDVCPVVELPAGASWDEYLATLGKKDRHEIRRKIRRAEAAGEVRFELVQPEPAAIEAFIALHQTRWGEAGLFPATEGGARSRRFLHRLAELELQAPDGGQLQLGRYSVGSRVIFQGLGFDDGVTCYFYNAGMDPAARELSPGVTGTAAYLRDRLEAGRRRFDFLRGDEPYKYEWGARDEPVERLLVLRAAP